MLDSIRTHLFPSGFISVFVGDLGGGEPPSIKHEVNFVKNTVSVELVQDEGKAPSDQEVDSLYHKYYRYGIGVKDFDLREAILKKAVEHLTLNRCLERWVNFIHLQLSSPQLSYNHIDFLKDITNYALRGGSEFHLSIWERILVNKANLRVMNESEKEKAGEILLKDINSMITINEMIINWVGQHGGYGHLVRTLKLMYGDVDKIHGQGE